MTWWRRGVLYEAYPRSFLDTDGDGVGDLRGVRAQLPYLRWLGVDAVWLTPIYPSPSSAICCTACSRAIVDSRRQRQPSP